MNDRQIVFPATQARPIQLFGLAAWENTRDFLGRRKSVVAIVCAFAIAWGVSQLPVPALLDYRGIYFLATLAGTAALLISGAYEDYVIGMLMLLTWVVGDVVPPKIALAGFSKTSWFFVVGVLGIGAALNKSGLLVRVILGCLNYFPPSYKIYTLFLALFGLLATPIMPTSKARIAISTPVSNAIVNVTGFAPRSNGSAGLALAAYVGFSQCAFMFLTGATSCLVGWNLLPETARAEFGWCAWVMAALPAGIVTLAALLAGIHVLLPLNNDDAAAMQRTKQDHRQAARPLSKEEWTGIGILALALLAWVGEPLHGVRSEWIALGALLGFLLSGAMTKDDFKNKIDWGFLFFLGVISGFDAVMNHLNIDKWLMALIGSGSFYPALGPVTFLVLISLLVYLLRFVLDKTPTVILLSTVGLSSWAQAIGIHPGIFLLTVLMANESWLLLYQNDAYQVTYYGTEGKAFSHKQARKLMAVRFLATFLALLVSVPYWRLLGFIR